MGRDRPTGGVGSPLGQPDPERRGSLVPHLRFPFHGEVRSARPHPGSVCRGDGPAEPGIADVRVGALFNKCSARAPRGDSGQHVGKSYSSEPEPANRSARLMGTVPSARKDYLQLPDNCGWWRWPTPPQPLRSAPARGDSWKA